MNWDDVAVNVMMLILLAITVASAICFIYLIGEIVVRLD